MVTVGVKHLENVGFKGASEGSLKGTFHRKQNNEFFTAVTEGTILLKKIKQKLTTYKLKYSGAGLFWLEIA